MQVRKYGEPYLLKHMSSNKPGFNTQLQSMDAKSPPQKYAEKPTDIGFQAMISGAEVLLYYLVHCYN